MKEKYFYVYKWYDIDTNEIFYIGKGCGNRYKDISKRNKDFLDYYNNHSCASDIIEYFDKEEDAFQKEYQLIQEYKQLGQAQTNLDDGGKGGCHFVWTPEMKDYWSRNNPMKQQEQRDRMSKNNPMYNSKVAQKVAEKNQVIFYIGDIEYNGFKKACEILNISEVTLSSWLKRGHTSDGTKCFYKDNNKRHDTIHRKTDKSVIVDNNFYFNTITDAAAYLDCSASYLGGLLRKGKNTYKNHKIEYANQQPSQENFDNSILEGSTTNG